MVFLVRLAEEGPQSRVAVTSLYSTIPSTAAVLTNTLPCFWTRNTRMNSNTQHFSDKAIKIIQFNLLYISCKNSHVRRARVTLFFRRTDQFRINGVRLLKQLQLNQCNLCLEKLYTGRQEDLTFQVVLHFHLPTHQIFVKSLPQPLVLYHSCGSKHSVIISHC